VIRLPHHPSPSLENFYFQERFNKKFISFENSSLKMKAKEYIIELKKNGI